jgi:hypothetical protein
MTASLTRTFRPAGLVLVVAASVSALSSTGSFAFTAEAQQMCDRRRVSPAQLRNSQYSEDHHVHHQAPCRSEHGLPNGDGQGSGPEAEHGRGAII